jgi:hypothetical protein
MDDYKVLKEAFHANNAGGSIWSINAISVAALVGHVVGLGGNVAHCYSRLTLFMHLHPGHEHTDPLSTLSPWSCPYYWE